MSEFKRNVLELDHKFDPKRKRHYLNGHLMVLHCHHYSTLYTQLALDAKETDTLYKVSETSFHQLVTDYLRQKAVNDLETRVDLGCQYYAAVGLGKMSVEYIGADSGRVVVENSHLDLGWIKKWGQYDRPVNYIGAGYAAALGAACLDLPIGSFQAKEVESMAMGAPKSVFNLVRN